MDKTFLGVIVFVTLSLVGAEGGFECYVCSWQKPTEKLEMQDNCTHYNFNVESASIVTCQHGCEAITYRKSKNEEVSHFTRNCLTERKGFGGKEDTCYNIEEKTEFRSICECHSDLCNNALSPRHSLESFYITAISLLLMMIVASIL